MARRGVPDCEDLAQDAYVATVTAIQRGELRDPKYLPFLRRQMLRSQQDYELRKILRAAKGMNGPEVRQLRLYVNKRMRTASASNLSID